MTEDKISKDKDYSDDEEEKVEEWGKSTANQTWIRNLALAENILESPIDLNIGKMKDVDLPLLEWINFDIPPKKMKITNTGHTIIFSGKWGQERPHLTNGPFIGKYVFSNWHLHWGANDLEGSEHTVDGSPCPAELHVITFKSCYLTQEAALKEQDGCATLVYFFKLQDSPNPAFQVIINSLVDIRKAGTSKKLEPAPIDLLLKKYESDYFFYWGSVSTAACTHYLMWLICRIPIGVSSEQISALRCILDERGEPLLKNFRNIQPIKGRTVLHVCPTTSKYCTLLPQHTYVAPIFQNQTFDMVIDN